MTILYVSSTGRFQGDGAGFVEVCLRWTTLLGELRILLKDQLRAHFSAIVRAHTIVQPIVV
jgi:hypothetical protein